MEPGMEPGIHRDNDDDRPLKRPNGHSMMRQQQKVRNVGHQDTVLQFSIPLRIEFEVSGLVLKKCLRLTSGGLEAF